MTLPNLDPGAIAAIAFLAVCLLLMVYAGRHRAKRLEALTAMMPTLGFTRMDEPPADQLVPDLLFHPNGFAPPGEPVPARYSDRNPRVPSAWTGRLAGRSVMVMDVVVDRSTRGGSSAENSRTSSKGSWTVLRCNSDPGPRPPDLLIDERVLFKNRVRDARAVNGPAQIGEHYFLFSTAADADLAPWITTALRSRLAEHRLWTIAAHDGVFYLKTAGSVYVMPSRMRQFLAEGEGILAALFAAERQ